MLRRSPGTTTVAILSLAFGIGVNTALLSAVDAVLLQSLPVKEPDLHQALDHRERMTDQERHRHAERVQPVQLARGHPGGLRLDLPDGGP